jgi:hypothetical protein
MSSVSDLAGNIPTIPFAVIHFSSIILEIFLINLGLIISAYLGVKTFYTIYT